LLVPPRSINSRRIGVLPPVGSKPHFV
jgi:hypothetical protein